MKNIYLITGAAGHLGSVLLKEILKTKDEIRILVLPDEKKIPEGNFSVFYGDVTDKKSLKQFFSTPENTRITVIHCAGIVTIASKHNERVYEVNVIGTKNIIELCKKYNVYKLIYISSVHAIEEKPKGQIISEPNGFNPDKVKGLYAKTKAEASAYVLEASKEGLNVNILFPSGICGPYDTGKSHMTTLVIDYYKKRLGAGIDGGYDFVDVRDVVNGIIACCDKGGVGESYILSNRFFTIREILENLYQVTGRNEIKIFLPLWFLKITAPLSEIYYKILKQPPLYTRYSIYTLTSNAMFSHSKATEELGYATRSMNETVEDTIKWLREEGRI